MILRIVMRIKIGYLKYLKRELISSPLEATITLLIASLLVWASIESIHWIIFDADWNIVKENLPLYAFGSYPDHERWRPELWLILLLTLTLITLLGPRIDLIRKVLPFLWIGIIPTGLILLSGGIGLRPIPSRDWGGITLTLLLTASSAILSLPLGIILALGRQSSMKLVKRVSRIYIDIMRAVPLIAVLFFGQLLIPLFLPMDFEINRVARAVFAFAFFTAAYIAEDIRGGLQAIPQTQKEAAAALGLSPLSILQRIVLPQALRTALPSLTNQAIGLLQNTSLMAILGLVELLGISRSLLANPKYIGHYLEVYIWLGGVYWFICTAMALLSKNIEERLNPMSKSNQKND